MVNEDQNLNQEGFMRRALELARVALEIGEVPVGCVIARDGRIIGEGYNRRNADHCALDHAEIFAIRQASQFLGDWRLEDCALYVTIEPCPMCAGAIVQARTRDVVFGARNPKAGCAGSVFNLLDEPRLNWRVNVTEGLLADEAAALMQAFFKTFRDEERSRKAARGMCPAFASLAANLAADTRALFEALDEAVREAAPADLAASLRKKIPTYTANGHSLRLIPGGGRVAIEADGVQMIYDGQNPPRDALAAIFRQILEAEHS